MQQPDKANPVTIRGAGIVGICKVLSLLECGVPVILIDRFDDTTKLLSFDLNGDPSSDMEIVLAGVSLSDLDANDFAFV